MFIDETWTKTNMTRTHGWAPWGQRLVGKVPHGHWKTSTFLAAPRHHRIEAPSLFEGPINGERFLANVEQSLVPTLKPGDVVIMDNLASHKSWAVRQAIRRVGAMLILLPKYLPDLNPIEQIFAKLKTLLRKAMARTGDAICTAIASILKTFTPQECANYLRNSGYDFTSFQNALAPVHGARGLSAPQLQLEKIGKDDLHWLRGIRIVATRWILPGWTGESVIRMGNKPSGSSRVFLIGMA